MLARSDRTAAAILDAAAHALSEHGRGANMADFARGLESGFFRQDLAADVLLELFGGALVAALKLIERGRIGLEEASAAAASVFLDGARARVPDPFGG